jgi:predicted nuclease of predicted toxin-antitoxin system
VSVRLYFDVHVPSAIADGLRLRGVDVITAQEDGAAEFEDPSLLDRASDLERVLVTQDEDFLQEASRRYRSGETFFGIVYARQRYVTIGECVRDLEIIAKDSETNEWIGRVEHLPL